MRNAIAVNVHWAFCSIRMRRVVLSLKIYWHNANWSGAQFPDTSSKDLEGGRGVDSYGIKGRTNR